MEQTAMTTAPIGPATVTVLGSHWRKTAPWDGFKWSNAEVRRGSIWSNDDYHLGVPWMHPNDREDARKERDPIWWAIYRLRLKGGWKSFVQVDGRWFVSKSPPQVGTFGTPAGGQVSMVLKMSVA